MLAGRRLLVAAALTALAVGEGAARGGAKLPASVDLCPRFAKMGLTPKDQGGRDTCSLHAVVALLEFEWGARTGKPVRFSEDFLNWASHQTTGRTADGSLFSDAVRGLNRFGVARAELMPNTAKYDPKAVPSAKAKADALTRRAATARWVKEWDVKTGMSAAQLRLLKERLAAGRPVAIGLRWPIGLEVDPGFVLKTPPPSGVRDGHSVVLVGYTDDARQPGGGTFLFRNSAGKTWGDRGHARLTYAYVAAYGNDALTLDVGGKAPAVPTNTTARHLHKAEDMKVLTARGCKVAPQDMKGWGRGLWNRDSQLFVGADKGAVLELRLQVREDGLYQVDFYGTRAPDFGKARLSLGGKRLGEEVDGYAARVEPTGRVALGEVRLKAGAHVLRAEVVDKATASKGYKFGIDGLDLIRKR